jgi:uncharacterized protein
MRDTAELSFHELREMMRSPSGMPMHLPIHRRVEDLRSAFRHSRLRLYDCPQSREITMFDECHWLNEPAEWSLADGALRVVTDASTDFWRETHYGFTRHSGHLFGKPVSGGATATLRIRASYESQYDQAGMMIRIDEANWVKAGIERSDGAAQLSSVATFGRSDWAAGLFHGDAADFWMRATVDRGVLRLQASTDGLRWPLLRLCPFPEGARYAVGPMCCTPERGGLAVLFSDFSVTPAVARDLHDLS